MLLAITVIGVVGIKGYLAFQKSNDHAGSGPETASCIGLNGALLEPRK